MQNHSNSHSTHSAGDHAMLEGAAYQTLTERAAVGLWHVDAAGRTRYANPAMLELLGVDSLADLLEAHYSEFFTPEGLLVVQAEEARRQKGISSSYETTIVGRRGRRVEVVVSGTPLLGKTGEVLGTISSFLEVTDLRHAERALRESQAILRSAVESLPFDFWAIGSDGRYCMLNAAAKENWGDLLGKRPEESGVPPEVLATWMENNRRALSGELVRGEVTFRDQSGLRHVENILAPIRDGEEVRGLLGVNIDITPRIVAEQARRDAHANLQSFLDHSSALVFLKDREGRYVMVNRQFERTFGITRYEVLGRTDHELFSAQQAAAFVANDREVLEAGAELEFEEVAHCTNGLRTSIVLKFPIRDENGAIVGTGGVATDVTDRRAAEQARRHADERFRILVENARDVIFTLDPDGTIASVNPACEVISGWSSSDWLGKKFGPLIHEEDRELANERFQEVLRGRQPAPFELRAIRKDDTILTVEVTLTPIVENGEVACALGVARDITERRQLETQLRQVQKMESVGLLAGGVAHDFNNILTVIQGHASLLQYTEGLPADVQDSIGQIAEATERAANLTRQLLAFSRKQLLRPRPLNINEVVADMSRMLRRILGEDIHLVVLPHGSLPLVQGDPGMIEQVIMNLAVNARDAMPSGGKLTISTCYSETAVPEAPARTPVPCVCLTIADTGCGIETEHLSRIFEPFFTTKGPGRGTGLGLATVYGIIHQHHGWITVDSKPGAGSVFRIHLPALLNPSELKPNVATAEGLSAQGSGRILIVEDETAVRSLIFSVLERLGYEVTTASSGIQALEVWRKNPGQFDLVVTDMVMPGGMSGRELAKELHGEEPDLPVIYTSGYAAEVISGEFQLREGENFLQKPYSPEQLSKLVRRTLARKTQSSH